MTNNHFVVSQRESVWQYSFRGDVAAPFTSKDAAVEAAISAASAIGDGDVAVVVLDAETRSETIWRAGQRSLTGPEAEQFAIEVERQSDA